MNTPAIQKIIDEADEYRVSHSPTSHWVPTEDEWVNILSACKTSKYFPALKLLCEIDNKPTTANDILHVVTPADLRANLTPRIDWVTTSLNTSMRKKDVRVTLKPFKQSVSPNSSKTKYCLFKKIKKT